MAICINFNYEYDEQKKTFNVLSPGALFLTECEF